MVQVLIDNEYGFRHFVWDFKGTVADVIRWRTLSEDSRAQIRAEMLALERSERQSAGPGRGRRRAGTDAGGAAGRGSRGRKDGTGV